MTKVGIREASTFPGFCEKHELEFSCYENKKTDKEALLQIFRTICREIAVKQKILEHIQNEQDNYIEQRNIEWRLKK
mgnify:FL=1